MTENTNTAATPVAAEPAVSPEAPAVQSSQGSPALPSWASDHAHSSTDRAILPRKETLLNGTVITRISDGTVVTHR
jgi:hypothetical protein